MADTFCPECGTVFDSAGSVCPNCAAIVEGGVAAPPPRSKPGSALSVMPLAKSSGQRRGFMDMDGADLQVNTRQRVQQEGVGHDQQVIVPDSGLGMEEREDRRAAQQVAPKEAAPEAIAARQAEEAAAGDSGWMKPILIVLVVVGVAVGGKFLMDYMKAEKKAPANKPADELTLDDY